MPDARVLAEVRLAALLPQRAHGGAIELDRDDVVGGGLAERARRMLKAAEILEKEKEAFARIMTTEMGKTLRSAVDEAVKCASACRYYAENAERFLAEAGFLRRFPTLAASPLEAIESLEQLRVLWHGERIAVHVSETRPGIGVDTAEDLARVRALFAQG